MYSSEAKKQLQEALEQESTAMLGEQMVYPLTEWLKDNLTQYVELSKQDLRKEVSITTPPVSEVKEASKEKMTKAQKRRFYSRCVFESLFVF